MCVCWTLVLFSLFCTRKLFIIDKEVILFQNCFFQYKDDTKLGQVT